MQKHAATSNVSGRHQRIRTIKKPPIPKPKNRILAAISNAMKTYILTILASALLLFSCQGQPSEKVKTVTAEEFAERLKQNGQAQILDVRTPDEFSETHLEHALNVDWYDQDHFAAGVSSLDKSQPVFVYCAAGARSKKAANRLAEMGFSQVYDLGGGVVKWEAGGFATAGSEPEKVVGMSVKQYEDLIKSNPKVLVDFFAPWCEPCKKMAPYLARIEREKTDLKIAKLNADEHKTLLKQMKVDALPRLILYVDGKPVWQHDGFISEEDLKKQL